MTDVTPKVRELARAGKIRSTMHATQRICQYKLTIMQVNEMLKTCNHNQKLDDHNGHRVEGRAPATDCTGTKKNISSCFHIGFSFGYNGHKQLRRFS